MEDISYTTQDGQVALTLKKEIYDKEAILAASNKFVDRYFIFIEPMDDFTINVLFKNKNNHGCTNLKKIVLDFCNELIEQQLRIILEKKFGNIRELIVQQAFSPVRDLESKISL